MGKIPLTEGKLWALVAKSRIESFTKKLFIFLPQW